LNKTYIEQLLKNDLIHAAGLKSIEIGKANGSWDALNDIDNELIPKDLQSAFDTNPKAFENYKNFATSYRKSYLYRLHSAKREVTRLKRIDEIIQLCAANKKQKDGNW
jgi:uncharacterized protein YdeI (YjbR/CyaY-like superfamily)